MHVSAHYFDDAKLNILVSEKNDVWIDRHICEKMTRGWWLWDTTVCRGPVTAKVQQDVPAFTSLMRQQSQILTFTFPQKGWKPVGLYPLKNGWLARVTGWLTALKYLTQYSDTSQNRPFILCLVFSLYLFQKLGLNAWTAWSHSKLCFWLQWEQYPMWLHWAPSPLNLQHVNTFLQLYRK